MRRRLPFVLVPLVLSACSGGEEAVDLSQPRASTGPRFAAVQPDLFEADGAQTNAWADYDGDSDLDLFIGFRGRPNRLYRNDGGSFVDVAAEVGLADEAETRASAWGDFDGDGDPDLYVGFANGENDNRLYRNDEGRFVDVAADIGVERGGVTRQPAWVDYDGDADLDLFVAFRDGPNALFRNDGDSFTDVTEASGIGDPRRTVGVAWFDIDGDHDLDAFVANQNGDEDALYRNRGDGTFVDVAEELGMNQPGRAADLGSVGTALADYDNDGDIDLFVASYGPDVLWENQGDGTFRNAAPGTPLAGDHHSVAAAWGDFDGDGWVDLYVDTFLSGEAEARDYLFRNVEGTFEEVLPDIILEAGASHGVSWADYDGDGDLDLSLANNHADGHHPLYQNETPPISLVPPLQIALTNDGNAWVRAGAKITVRRSSDDFVTSRILDTGGGYASQSLMPVHVTLPPSEGGETGAVDIELSWFEAGEGRTSTVSGVQPEAFFGRWLVLAVSYASR